MSDPESLIQELRTKLDELATEVSHLQEQVDELHDQNERLQRENKSLREEVTVVRLYQEMSEEEEEAFPPESMSSIPRQALLLYRELPSAFKFAEFFQVADDQGLDPGMARNALLQLLREDLLVQKGARIEKSDPGSRTFEVEKHMQPSSR